MRLRVTIGVVAALALLAMVHGGEAPMPASQAATPPVEQTVLATIVVPSRGADSFPGLRLPNAPQPPVVSAISLARRELLDLWDEEAVANPRFDRLRECGGPQANPHCGAWRNEADFSMVTRVPVEPLRAIQAETLLALLSDDEPCVRLLALRGLEVSGFHDHLPFEVYQTLENRRLAEVVGVLARHVAIEATVQEADAILEYSLDSSDSRVLNHAAVALGACQHRSRLQRLMRETPIQLDDTTRRLVDSRCTAPESP